MIWVAVAVGGAAGSVARHALNIAIGHAVGRPVPYATAGVNLLGSFVVGILAGLIATGRLQMTPVQRAFVFVGILGGFTTFSSFMLDTLTLAQGGERTTAFANVAAQTVAGTGLVWAGYAIAHGMR